MWSRQVGKDHWWNHKYWYNLGQYLILLLISSLVWGGPWSYLQNCDTFVKKSHPHQTLSYVHGTKDSCNWVWFVQLLALPSLSKILHVFKSVFIAEDSGIFTMTFDILKNLLTYNTPGAKRGLCLCQSLPALSVLKEVSRFSNNRTKWKTNKHCAKIHNSSPKASPVPRTYDYDNLHHKEVLKCD